MKWVFWSVIVLGVAAVVWVVKWKERCPRCKSLRGPTNQWANLLPNDGLKLGRVCRKCGHTWVETGNFDPMAP